jgi:hypothetical protein
MHNTTRGIGREAQGLKEDLNPEFLVWHTLHGNAYM